MRRWGALPGSGAEGRGCGVSPNRRCPEPFLPLHRGKTLTGLRKYERVNYYCRGGSSRGGGQPRFQGGSHTPPSLQAPAMSLPGLRQRAAPCRPRRRVRMLREMRQWLRTPSRLPGDAGPPWMGKMGGGGGGSTGGSELCPGHLARGLRGDGVVVGVYGVLGMGEKGRKAPSKAQEPEMPSQGGRWGDPRSGEGGLGVSGRAGAGRAVRVVILLSVIFAFCFFCLFFSPNPIGHKIAEKLHFLGLAKMKKKKNQPKVPKTTCIWGFI